MKILYFIEHIDAAGGAERVLILKANYLVEKLGYQVQIVVKEYKPSFFKLNSAIKIHDLQLANYKKKFYENKVRKIIHREKPDVCIALWGMYIYFLHKIKDGSKKIVELHSSKQSMFFRAEESFFLFFFKKIYRRWFLIKKMAYHLKKYDRFIQLTYQDQKDWGRLKNSQVIPNPITFSIKNTLPDYQAKIVLSVGRISYSKGFEYLVEVWKIIYFKYPDWKLIILGRCNNNDTLDDYIKKHKLENVIQVHPVTPNVQEYYQKASVYIATSLFEGFPMTLLEAATCGLPIVTWRCPTGPSEIVNHEEDGLLSDYMNIQALADNLMKLMKDEQKRKQYGQAAQKNIQRFSMENIMKQWEVLFKEICLEENINNSIR